MKHLMWDIDVAVTNFLKCHGREAYGRILPINIIIEKLQCDKVVFDVEENNDLTRFFCDYGTIWEIKRESERTKIHGIDIYYADICRKCDEILSLIQFLLDESGSKFCIEEIIGKRFSTLIETIRNSQKQWFCKNNGLDILKIRSYWDAMESGAVCEKCGYHKWHSAYIASDGTHVFCTNCTGDLYNEYDIKPWICLKGRKNCVVTGKKDALTCLVQYSVSSRDYVAMDLSPSIADKIIWNAGKGLKKEEYDKFLRAYGDNDEAKKFVSGYDGQ